MIRPAAGDDAHAIAAIYAPIVRDTAISFEIDPPSTDEIRRRIEATGDAFPWRGRGAGAGLYHALLEILALQGFHRAYAGITLPNTASVRLHESVGFTPLGVFRKVGFKLGAWHDVGWWERTLARAGDPPEVPRAFAAVALEPAVAAVLAAGAAIVHERDETGPRRC